MQLQVAFDSSLFIERSIDSVYRAMGEAVLLVMAVIFVFLRSLRSTLIPFVTIPVSLVGSFFFLYLMGFTINVLTLLGMVLAIGLVVDDAIVVLENCHRHVEMGKTPQQAAADGSREIAFAVVAMSLTLTAVFAPVAFVPGNTGKLFAEFALTVAAAVAVSGFVALTLTPMMCSKILKAHEKHGGLYLAMERFFTGMTNGYRAPSVGLCNAQALPPGGCLRAGHRRHGPDLRKAEAGALAARGPRLLPHAHHGARGRVDGIHRRLRARGRAHVRRGAGDQQHVRGGGAGPGAAQPGQLRRHLHPARAVGRARPQDAADHRGDGAEARAPRCPACSRSRSIRTRSGQGFRTPQVQYVVQGNSYEELDAAADKLLAKARDSGSIVNADSDLKLNKPQLSVDIDREKAAALGIDVEVIGRTLETLLGGRQVTRFKREGKQYDVMVQLEAKDRNTPADLTSIYVRARDGSLVQLSNLVQVRETVAAKELNHFNRARAAIITGNVAPGSTLGEALDFLDRAAARNSSRPASAPTSTGCRANSASRAPGWCSSSCSRALFIYLMLSAQFESFVSPFVIMLTVPLAGLGALAAIWLTGGTLNVYSKVGLVMLIGLITKHGILIVEFANQLRERGVDAGRGGGRGGDAAPAPDPDDHRRHGARRAAARARHGRGRRGAPGDRLGDRRRAPRRHAVHPVRDSDRVPAPRAPPYTHAFPAERCRQGCLRATPRW